MRKLLDRAAPIAHVSSGTGESSRFGARICVHAQVTAIQVTLARPTLQAMSALIDFRLVGSRADLARHLSCAPKTLDDAIEGGVGVYRVLRLPKRSARRAGEFRVVYEVLRSDVADALKTFGRRFYDYARRTDARFPSPHAHGYLSGHSILTNAQVHVGTTRMVRADIADFFPSITREWVQRILQTLEMPETGAKEAASLLTIDGHLPLGLPSSPLIANLSCVSLDEKLAALASRLACRFSRYADDLTFSSNGELPSRIEIASVLEAEGFTLSSSKFSSKKRGQSFYVTGLSVSEPDRPRVARPLKQRLRRELRFIEKFGLTKHLGRQGYSTFQKGVNSIDGLIRFMRGIEPALGRAYQKRWAKALADANMLPAYPHRPGDRVSSQTWLVDESVIDSPHGSLMMLALVIVEDVDYVESALNQELERLRRDPFYSGSVSKLQKKGLHFVDLNEDARASVAKILQALPLRAYVVVDRKIPEEPYQAQFLRLLGDLLDRRLSAAANADVRLMVEENSAISKQELVSDVAQRVDLLKARGARRPFKVETIVVTKASTLAALPDLLMGFLGGYLKPDAQHSARQRFERLRDKIRTIRSLFESRTYGRRRPIEPWPTSQA